MKENLLIIFFLLRAEVKAAGFEGSVDELDEATAFWHENGTLRHFGNCTDLQDCYFLDPQWLCSTLTKVVTVQQDVSAHKSCE